MRELLRAKGAVFLVIWAALSPLAVWTEGASASFPGTNGRIAYRDLSGDLWSMQADGTGRIQLTSSDGPDGMPAWSADGTKIAFISGRNGQLELFTMNSDGSEQKRLTTNVVTSTSAANDWDPTWSPDRSRVAFVHQDGYEFEGHDQIHVINADGSARKNVTNTASGVFRDPAWSPDGSKIAFTSAMGTQGIGVMDPDGSNRRVLNPGTASAEPSWSPDGKKIAFSGFDVEGTRIWTMDADGSNQKRITDEPGEAPAWSPDGHWIVFERPGEDGRPPWLYLIPPDGTDESMLGEGHAMDPDWQPLNPPNPASPSSQESLTDEPVNAGLAPEPSADATRQAPSPGNGTRAPNRVKGEGGGKDGPLPTPNASDEQNAVGGAKRFSSREQTNPGTPWAVVGSVAGVALTSVGILVLVRLRGVRKTEVI